LLTTEVIIDLIPVTCPVAVVASIGIIDDRWYPNGIESEILNVLELFDDTCEVTSAVVVQVA
jgi:hypothetical protein